MLRKHGRILLKPVRDHQPRTRPEPLLHRQTDLTDTTTIIRDESIYEKKQHLVEALNIVDEGTSFIIASVLRSDFHAQTILDTFGEVFKQIGRPSAITLDRDPRFVGPASGRDFPRPCCVFSPVLGSQSTFALHTVQTSIVT